MEIIYTGKILSLIRRKLRVTWTWMEVFKKVTCSRWMYIKCIKLNLTDPEEFTSQLLSMIVTPTLVTMYKLFSVRVKQALETFVKWKRGRGSFAIWLSKKIQNFDQRLRQVAFNFGLCWSLYRVLPSYLFIFCSLVFLCLTFLCIWCIFTTYWKCGRFLATDFG